MIVGLIEPLLRAFPKLGVDSSIDLSVHKAVNNIASASRRFPFKCGYCRNNRVTVAKSKQICDSIWVVSSASWGDKLLWEACFLLWREARFIDLRLPS